MTPPFTQHSIHWTLICFTIVTIEYSICSSPMHHWIFWPHPHCSLSPLWFDALSAKSTGFDPSSEWQPITILQSNCLCHYSIFFPVCLRVRRALEISRISSSFLGLHQSAVSKANHPPISPSLAMIFPTSIRLSPANRASPCCCCCCSLVRQLDHTLERHRAPWVRISNLRLRDLESLEWSCLSEHGFLINFESMDACCQIEP